MKDVMVSSDRGCEGDVTARAGYGGRVGSVMSCRMVDFLKAERGCS